MSDSDFTRDNGGDEGWVSPTPASTAIAEAVTERTDLDASEIDDIDAYVDVSDLDDVLSSDEGTITFRIEGYEVTVGADGDIDVT